MPRKRRSSPTPDTICATCGQPFSRNPRTWSDQCAMCRTGHAMTVAQQIHERRGPAWERCVRRSLEHWQEQARLLDLQDRQPPAS